MGHNGQKLVQARPRDGPDRWRFGQLRHPPEGGLVKWRILAMRIDENIGIDRDYAPRSW
jgi:hypothetical protein